jgi:hypothetical protein
LEVEAAVAGRSDLNRVAQADALRVDIDNVSLKGNDL